MKMKKSLTKIGMAVLCGGATLAFASQHGAEEQSTQNPANPINQAIGLSITRALDATERREAVHAAEGESEGFRYPAVFVEYGYSNMQDNRRNGFDTIRHTTTLGMDFMTFGDFFVGGMVSYGEYDGENDFNVNSAGDTWAFTLYGSKAVGKNLYAGTSVSYSHDDAKGGQDTDTYSIAPYLSYLMYVGDVKISVTPTYALSFSENDPTDDKSDRGEFLLVTRASMATSEAITLYAGATLHQVLHSHLMDGEDGQDHTWIGTSVGMKWMITEMVSLDASVGYDAFNENYRNNMNARTGVTVQF